ncbi:superoxide dismutase family protein [Falsirhodobacter sp. alg1]|uniref:superoxide dismutase family protein n=1 Tax=Falsirhodobacter sp. alg1 TaxID=1472418 RepID=UPI0005EDDC50|nr:superoxide dismutase family protein [Falsirhodobacter sp. alg1]
MKRIAALVATCVPLLALPTYAQDMPTPKEATFVNTDGENIGTAEIRPVGEGVLISVDIKDLPEGPLSLHVHETGSCEGDFKSAGGHYNPTGVTHGFFSDTGPHAGDMPNQSVNEDGEMVAEVLNTMIPFDDMSGKALVVHDGPDDYVSDPAGNAGNRIACAVIE